MKLIENIRMSLQLLKEVAHAKEDGNSLGLMNRIERDLNSLMPEYQQCTADDAFTIAAPQTEEEAEARKNFVAASYERTGAQDVNKPPLPPTGEENTPPFVSKADVTADEDGALKLTPDKDDGGVTNIQSPTSNGKKKAPVV